MQRHVLVDGKVRTDKTYPAGFMGMKFSFSIDFYITFCRFILCMSLSVRNLDRKMIFAHDSICFPYVAGQNFPLHFCCVLLD